MLMFFYNSGLSGGPRISTSLASTLQARGEWQIDAILPSEGETAEWLQKAGVRVRILPREPLRATWRPTPHFKYWFKFASKVSAYRAAIREAQPSLVHVDSLLNLPALAAAKLSGVKSLLHVQEVAHGAAGRSLAAIAGALADRIVCVSEAAAQPFGDKHSKKLAVVANGVRIPDAGPYRPDGWVTFVGRLSADKNPVAFVQAAGQVYADEQTRGHEARFRIVGLTVPGRDRYEERLQRAIRQSGIAPQSFSFLRDRKDVGELLGESSIVVNCSAGPESCGLAVLEAVAAGVPVVVPRAGAFPEYIRHGETGLLYQPGNVQEMAECILRLLREPGYAEGLGRAARELACRQFREERMVEEMVKQYRVLLGR